MASNTPAIHGSGKHGREPDQSLWDAAAVKSRLEEAAETLKVMMLSSRDRPAGMGSGWPDIVQESCEVLGFSDVRVRPAAPPPARISRADEAVIWLLWLNDAERRVTWARASGITWRRLEDMDGRSHVTLRKILASALECICRHLNAETLEKQPNPWMKKDQQKKNKKGVDVVYKME